jgi:hypothetical protein
MRNLITIKIKVMKKILNIICAVVLFLNFGCSSKSLELNPVDSGSVDGFFTSTSDVVAGVNGVYRTLRGDIWGGAFVHLQPHFEGVTENAIICCNWEYQYKDVAQGVLSAATGGVVRWKWEYGYQAIFRVNSILAVIESGTIEDLTPEVANKLKGELLFIRAYVTNEMTLLYGDIPLVQKVLTPDEAKNLERDPKATVVDAMYDDLDFAIANLDTSPFQNEPGRPTKLAAIVLKGRAQMWNNDFSGAAITLKQIIDLEGSVVRLDSDYASLFKGDNEQSPEILWSLQAVGSDVGAGQGSFISVHYGPNSLGGTVGAGDEGWATMQWTDAMVDEFRMSDGLPSSQSPLYDPANPFANRDSRFDGTFYYPGRVYRGVTLGENNFSSNGQPKRIKIASSKWKSESSNDPLNSDVNLVLIRYAEALLLYAEALNETVGPTAEVYASLNKLRDRANVPHVTPGMTQAQMRAEIKHETEVEQTLEGLHYFNLLRWKDAEVLIPSVTEEVRTFDPAKHYMWPIPQFARDQSPKLTQNPFY